MAVVTEVMALAVLAGVIVLLVRYLSNYLHFRKLELAIPGPPSLWFVGNALDFAFVTPDTVMKTLLRMIGGRREMCRVSLFNNLLVMVSDPEEIKELACSKKFNDKSVFFYSLIHVCAKKGLVQLGGAEWKSHRKWLAPAFNMHVLNSYAHIFSEEAKGFMDRVEVDEDVDVHDNLTKALVRSFLRTSVSSSKSLEYENVAMDGFAFAKLFVRSVNNRSFNPLLWSDLLFTSLTPLGRTVYKTKQVLDEHCRSYIAKKRVELQHQNEYDFERKRKTLIDIMLEPNAGSEKLMEEDDIIDEALTFFGANVLSTVSALSWTLKVLSLLPEVQEQVHAELVSVFGECDRDVSIEDLSELQYLSRVIKEVMRMFPPTPFIARQCYNETKLCGHTIPAGTTCVISIFGAHRDPEYWDKPEVFDPDRFLPERCKDRHPCAYMPFSAGPRKCLGNVYAMMNMTTFLAHTLRAFKVLPVGDHKDLQSLVDNISFDFSSYIVGGTRVKFQRRRAIAA